MKDLVILGANTTANFKEVRRTLRALVAQQAELELCVLAQPSGGARNLLTEANIHLLESISKLKELLT